MLWWRNKSSNPSSAGASAARRSSNVAHRTRTVPFEDDDTEEDELMINADAQRQTDTHEEEQQATDEEHQPGQIPAYETCREDLDEQAEVQQQQGATNGQPEEDSYQPAQPQHEVSHHQEQQLHQHQASKAVHPCQPHQPEQQVEGQQQADWGEDEDVGHSEDPAVTDDRQPYWHKTGALILPLPEGLPTEAAVRVELNGVMLPPAATEKVKLVHLRGGWGKVGPLRSIKPLIEGAEQMVCCTYQGEGSPMELLLQVQWAPPSATQLKGYVDRNAYARRPAVAAHASQSTAPALYTSRRSLEALNLMLPQGQPLSEVQSRPIMAAVELDGVFIPFQACAVFKRSPKGSSWSLSGFPGLWSLVAGARVTSLELLLPAASAAPASGTAGEGQQGQLVGGSGVGSGDQVHGMAPGLLVLKAATIKASEGAQQHAPEAATQAQLPASKQQARQSELWLQQARQQPATQKGQQEQQEKQHPKQRATPQHQSAEHVHQRQQAELTRRSSASVRSQQPSGSSGDVEEQVQGVCAPFPGAQGAGPSSHNNQKGAGQKVVDGGAHAVGEAGRGEQDNPGGNADSRETSPDWQEEGLERATNSDTVPHWDKGGNSLLLALPQGIHPGHSPVRLEVNGVLLPAAVTENIQLQRQKGALTKVILNRNVVWLDGAQLLMCSTLEGQEGGATSLVLRVHWPVSRLGQKGSFDVHSYGERKRCTGYGIQTTLCTGIQMHNKVVSALGLEPNVRLMTAIQRDGILIPLQQPTHLAQQTNGGGYYCRIKGVTGLHRLGEGCKVTAIERWMPLSGPATAEGTDGHQYVTGLLVAHLVTKDDPAPGGTAVEVQTGSGSRAGTGEPPRKRAKLAANLRVPGNADEQGEAAVPAPAEELVDEEELAQEGMADEGAEQQHPAIQAAGAQAPGKVPAAAGAQAARAPAQHTQRPTIPKPQQAPAAQPSQKAPQRVSRGGSSSDDTRVTQEVPSKQDGQAGAPPNALPELDLRPDASLDANTRRLITRALLPAIKLVASTPATRSAANLKLLEVGDQDLLTFVLGGSYDVLRDAVADGGQDECMLGLARALLGRVLGQQL